MLAFDIFRDGVKLGFYRGSSVAEARGYAAIRHGAGCTILPASR